jgi:hypothetical protein
MTRGHAAVQDFNRQPVAVEAGSHSHASPCGIYCGQSGKGTGVFAHYFCFPPSVSCHQCSIFIHSFIHPSIHHRGYVVQTNSVITS